MNRRKFIRNTAGLGFAPIFINSTFMKAYDHMLGFDEFSCNDIQNRAIVFIDLYGGNDGLNTVIPVQQSLYDLYAASRPAIALPRTGSNGILNLDNTIAENRQIGLHPSLLGLKALYDDGKINVVNGVGYSNNSRSHFQASDHWLSAGDATAQYNNVQSGWVGRYITAVFPDNVDKPSSNLPDPLGLELGTASSSLLFKTAEGKNSNVILSADASGYYNSVTALGAPMPANYISSRFRDEIEYINSIEQSANLFSNRITEVFNNGTNAISYPDNLLANQLKTVARLIKGGSKTKVFLVHQGSYDTHVRQAEMGATSTGTHATLLKILGDSVKAFQEDLQSLGIEDNVLTVTYSEFGRSIDQNANGGTDHGGVNPMFIIGKGVTPGISGNPVDLTKVEDRGCIDLQFDYRSIYANLLQDFLAVNDTALAAALPPEFVNNKASIVQTSYVAPPSCYNSLSVLPVVLVDFTATALGSEAVRVNWATSQEMNAKDFVLERSADATNFAPIARVAAVGNSYTQQNYEWLDYEAREGVNYYRLLQSDMDGKYQYFGPARVSLQKTRITNIKSYPNPSVNEFTISISSVSRQKANIVFMDMDGHALHQVSVQLVAGANSYQYNHLQFRGTKQLLITVRLENGKMETLKHIMQ